MKKVVTLILALITVFSALVIPGSAADAPSYSLSSAINIKKATGLGLANDAGHGNHQTRTVHTSHGDYAAYVTKDFTNESYQSMTRWSLFKIDPATGSAKEIFSADKYYDSSQVSLIVDNDENVWAITSTSDSKRNLSSEGFDCRAYKLDAKTGKVTSYTSIISGGPQDGYGYATCFYDQYKNRIIVMHAGGDYVKGQKKASLNWTIFNIDTNKWDTRVRSAMIEARHCYMYGYIDQTGGMMIIAQRDIKAASLGYPEIGSDDGLSSSDRAYMQQNGITRWAANYCWDQLDLFYFPSVTSSKHTMYSVCEADYSQVTGTQAERYTLAKRLSNYYPAIQNNNGGDFLLTEDANGKLLLHITYNKALIQAAMNRSTASECKWYHQVWDVTDGKSPVKLYDGVIADEMAGESGYSFRLYEDSKGNVNIVSGHTGTLTIYRTEYNGKGGYNYHKIGKTLSLPGAGNLINISSHRANSKTDDKINILYTSSGTYSFCQVTLSPAEYEPIPCSHNYILSEALSTPATCTKAGIGYYTCSYCNNTQNMEIPALGHEETETYVAPTCTEDGSRNYSCKNCSYSASTTVPALGHSFKNGECSVCRAPDPDHIPTYTKGDINGDGTINSKDSNVMKRFFAGVASASEAQRFAADVDGNGVFNAIDANALARLISGM